MTSSEDEKADKASSFVDQKKGSKRSHLNVSERASNRAGIAQPMRSSSNVTKITDEKCVKKARWSASRDRQTHVSAATLSTSDEEAVAGNERRAGAASSQRKSTVLKPCAKTSTKKVSSVRQAKTTSREVEPDVAGVCCSKNTSTRYPPHDEIEKIQGSQNDDKLSSNKSMSTPGCVCKSTDSKTALSGTGSEVDDTATSVPPCINLKSTEGKPTEASSEVRKGEGVERQHTRVSDNAELPEPVPPCVKCQGIELKSTPDVTQRQASDTKMEAPNANSEPPEQQSSDGRFPTGKPCTCSLSSVKNLDRVNDDDRKVTKTKSECPIQLDCDDRKPTMPHIEDIQDTESEISEGTVLASNEVDTLDQQSSDVVEKPTNRGTINSVTSSKHTKARAKIQNAKPTRSRSQSRKSHRSKITSKDKTQSQERSSVNATKITKKNCILIKWNPFKKISKALSMSSKSDGSSCQCDLSPEPNKNQKEETSTNAGKPDHQTMTSVPSSKPRTRDQSTIPTSTTQSKPRSTFATKDTCRLCKQETLYEKAKLGMSRSQTIADKSDLQETRKQCPSTIPKCWVQESKTRQDSRISQKKNAPISISKSASTSEPKCEQKSSIQDLSEKPIPPLPQQCQSLPKCRIHDFKDKPGSTSSIDKEKSVQPPSSCKIECAKSKPISTTEKDNLVDNSSKINPPSSPSSCRIHCPTNESTSSTSTSKAEKNSEPRQEFIEKSIQPPSSCKIECAKSKPISTTEKDNLVDNSSKINPPSSPSSCRIHCPTNESTSSTSTSKAEKNSEPRQEFIEKSIPPTSSEPKCAIHKSANKPDVTSSTSTKETEKEYENKIQKKSISENNQNKPKCWIHEPLDEPVCTNETKNAEKFVSPSQSPKCWVYDKANRHGTEAKYKTEPDSTGNSVTHSPSTKCWMHRTKHGPLPNPCARTEKDKNVVQDSPGKPHSSKLPFPKCWTHPTVDEPVVTSPKSHSKEKSISSASQESQCVPQCGNQSVTDKTVPSSSPSTRKSDSENSPCKMYSVKSEPVTTLPNTPKKCGAGRELVERSLSPILQKCQPLPKCWVFGTKDEPVKSPSANQSNPTSSSAQKKCEVVRSLPEKDIQSTMQKCQPLPKCWKFGAMDKSLANKSNPTSPNAQKKCEAVKNLPEKNLSTLQKCNPLPKCWKFGAMDKSLANKSNPTSPNAQKKCEALRNLPEKNLSTLQKCNPLPKCWVFGTKDESVTKSPNVQKKCNAGKGLAEKSTSPTFQKCPPLPKCWLFDKKDEQIPRSPVDRLPSTTSKISKKCETIMERHNTPTSQECKLLPKCWEQSTKEKPISKSSTDESASTSKKSSPELQKCLPLPNCMKRDAVSDSVSTLDKPTSPVQNICKCKTDSESTKETPVISQKAENRCQSLPKCWTLEKPIPVSTTDKSSSNAVSQVSTDLNGLQVPKQRNPIEDICAKRSPTVSSRSDSATPSSAAQKDLCGLSCSRKVSAAGSNSVQLASTQSPITDQRKHSNNTCELCCTRRPVSAGQTPAPSSLGQTTQDHKVNGMCPTFCQQQSSKQLGSSRHVSTSSPKHLNPSSSTPHGNSCHKRLSTESTSKYKCALAKTTHSSSSSATSESDPGATCSKPSNLSIMEEEPTAPHAVKSTSAGASTASTCGKPCDVQNMVKRSLTETESRSSSSHSSGSKSKETASMPAENFCQPCSSQKSIQPDLPISSNNNTTTAPISRNESHSTLSSNLCPPTCSTQFHKGQQRASTSMLESTTSRSQDSATTHSDNHATGNICQPCHSPNHSDKSTPTSIGSESISLPPGNITQDQTYPDNSKIVTKIALPHSEAVSPECKECSRLRATPAPKCENCAKKSVPTKLVEANTAVSKDFSIEKNSGGASFPSCCRVDTTPTNKVSHETELKHTERAIDDMINEGPVVHPDSVKPTKKDSPDKKSAPPDCIYISDDKPRPVDYEAGKCCKSSGSFDEKKDGPQLQCSVPTTTAAPMKENEIGSESTKFTNNEDATSLDNEETTDVVDEKASSSSVDSTFNSCPVCNSTSDEKDEVSIAASQPKTQMTKQTSQPPSGRGLEKKPLKQAPKRVRKRTIVDANDQEAARKLKNPSVGKRTSRQRTLDDQSGKKILYRSNRSLEYRRKAKKVCCGRRRYSSTDSEERMSRGQIRYRSRPHIPVTLTHAVHLRRRHTDKSRERMLAEMNKKKKHDTRFQ